MTITAVRRVSASVHHVISSVERSSARNTANTASREMTPAVKAASESYVSREMTTAVKAASESYASREMTPAVKAASESYV